MMMMMMKGGDNDEDNDVSDDDDDYYYDYADVISIRPTHPPEPTHEPLNPSLSIPPTPLKNALKSCEPINLDPPHLIL